MDRLIDAHCHLDFPEFNDMDAVVKSAESAGLKIIVAAGVDALSNRKVLDLQSKYPLIKASLGIYPPSALASETENKNPKFDIDEEIKFIAKNKDHCLFIGEVGLDYARGKDPHQAETFQKVIDLAQKLKKPLVVHSRKAESDVVLQLESSNAKKVIMHCFSGNSALIKKIEANGWYFSIPTNIVRSSHFQELVKKVDINQLLAETDSPFLSPFKDKPNEPAFVIESYKKIAEIKAMDIIEVENNIFMNFQKLL